MPQGVDLPGIIDSCQPVIFTAKLGLGSQKAATAGLLGAKSLHMAHCSPQLLAVDIYIYISPGQEGAQMGSSC